MHIRLLIIMVALCVRPVCAEAEMHHSKWDIYLDHAHELTFWEEKELRSWIRERENEFGEALAQYSETWHEKIKSGTVNDDADRGEGERLAFSEHVYKRLAVADLILYLESRKLSRLDDAIRTIEVLKGKFENPEIAFWYYFIHAHEAISSHDFEMQKASDLFVRNMFRIWLDVVLPLEEVHDILNIPSIPVSITDFTYSLPYLYENIADIILTRAIVSCELENTGPLGIIIRGLDSRLSIQKGYAEKVRAVVNRMSGPKSDIYHLNFTVFFLEAEENRFDAQRLLNEEGATSSSAEAFRKAERFYRLSFAWASTRQAQVAVISDYLDMRSFVFSRLAEQREVLKGSPILLQVTAQEHPLTVKSAIDLFEELAQKEIRGSEWMNRGFLDRKDYISAMHGLWNSIAEYSLWCAYFYGKGLTPKEYKDYSSDVISSQASLSSYLNFFDRNLKNGSEEVIPDNAYFNAAEAAARLSVIFYQLAPYSYGMNYYHRSFARLLEYVEIFPYNPEAIIELAQRLNEVGQSVLYVQYIFPLIERLRNSESVNSWIKTRDNSESLKKLQSVVPGIMHKANTIVYLQGKGAEKVWQVMKTRVDEIENRSRSFIKEMEINLQTDNLTIARQNLDNLLAHLALLSSQQDDAREKLLEDIKKLRDEIIEFEETNRIIEDLPEYVEDSRKIRKALAQRINDPMHALFRQLYHEIPIESKKYYQFLSVLNKDKH